VNVLICRSYLESAFELYETGYSSAKNSTSTKIRMISVVALQTLTVALGLGLRRNHFVVLKKLELTLSVEKRRHLLAIVKYDCTSQVGSFSLAGLGLEKL
jgi:hypothetical protein